MPGVLDRLTEGLLICCGLYYGTVYFIKRAQWKIRMEEILGKAKGRRAFWRGQAAEAVAWIPWLLWIVLSGVALARTPGPASWRIDLMIITAQVWMHGDWFAGMLLRRRRSQAEASRLSRGVLFDSVRKMARRAGVRPRVYVLRDLSQAPLLENSVLLPRQLLDTMNRREIDALAARQFCRQSKRYYYPPILKLLAFDAVAAYLVDLLATDSAARWIAFPALLAIQCAALAIYLPRPLAAADSAAVKLTGPETFLSALAGLARFNAAPVTGSVAAEPRAAKRDLRGPYAGLAS